MEVSKLTFTPDFQEKTTKTISRRKKGSLRKKLLDKAEQNGKLQLCKNRNDVGELLGIPKGLKTRQYVYNVIKRGELTETLVGTHNGKKEYEYHYRNNKFSLNKPIKNRSFDEFVKNFSVEKNEDVCGIEIEIDWNKHTLNVKNITVDSIVAIVKELAK